VKVLIGSWFNLPRLGRDEFTLLMRQGVKYDRAMGFKMDGDTDLDSALRTIRSATGEEVELAVRCFLCGREACSSCPYLGACDRRRVSSLCLCADHALEKGVYELYVEAVSGFLAS
jgi:hypothetical protein